VSDLADYIPTLTTREKAFMKFARRMLETFMHDVDEALRTFLRKPNNPRKILTKLQRKPMGKW
jgi:hypothetical protein